MCSLYRYPMVWLLLLYIPYFYRQRSWILGWIAQYHMIGTAEIWTRVWGQTLDSLYSLKNLNISLTDYLKMHFRFYSALGSWVNQCIQPYTSKKKRRSIAQTWFKFIGSFHDVQVPFTSHSSLDSGSTKSFGRIRLKPLTLLKYIPLPICLLVAYTEMVENR